MYVRFARQRLYICFFEFVIFYQISWTWHKPCSDSSPRDCLRGERNCPLTHRKHFDLRGS